MKIVISAFAMAIELAVTGRTSAEFRSAAENWGKNFKQMVSAWGRDIGDPKLPVIVLLLRPGTEQTLSKFPYRDVVREQQPSVQNAKPHQN